ncbi:MAG: HAMP domain-containing sensor histidine kinase [Polyangiales bacterium]|jgi:signal transduction histidine kinase
MTAPSIERSVVRSYLTSIVGVSLAIVAASAVMTTLVVVERDDTQAQALALTLGAELHDHRSEALEPLGTLVAHELEEQKWLQRTVEVYRGETRIGGAADGGRLRSWADLRGCELAKVDGTLSRLCAVEMDGNTAIVVASPIAPLLYSQLPILAAVALAALLASAVFAIVARRVVRRGLQPLEAFERSLAELKAPHCGPVPASWGAVEVDRLAQTFNALLERIDAAVQREHRFVSNAAHELRTPLTRLRGQIDLVLQEGSAGAESSRRLSLAARSCEELSRSVDALLALARDQAAPSEAVDLGELAVDVIGALDDDRAQRIHLVAEPALVRGDPALLGLAAGNLLDNALKYSDGGVEVVVADSEQASFIVLDRGPGIPEPELPAVREPFVRGKSGYAGVRGTGLGLALADHVAKLHHGELRLENRSPSGLRAAIVLPSWRAS